MSLTTEPESTEPESTEPESTEPESTEPESTEPESTGDGDAEKGQSRVEPIGRLQFVNFVPGQDDETQSDETQGDETQGDETQGDETQGDGETAETPDDADVSEESAVIEDVSGPELVNAETVLTFTYPIDQDGVQEAIAAVADDESLSLSADAVVFEDVSRDDSKGKLWRVEIKNTKEGDVKLLMDGLVNRFAEKTYFRSIADVGGQIAADAQVQAIAAILASLIGIVVYLWFRFQRVIFGFAAVVALVHDVAIVLGVIALSCWLNPVLGTILLVDNFKISLPVIAAFLTIIGYSLNDTIVVFDRIREVKGKNPKLTEEMLDTSISQTLSRTLLTSITTLIVVGILYFLGGEAIHAFAFSLVIGVFVGTYSSIFVASPALYWLAKRTEKG